MVRGVWDDESGGSLDALLECGVGVDGSKDSARLLSKDTVSALGVDTAEAAVQRGDAESDEEKDAEERRTMRVIAAPASETTTRFVVVLVAEIHELRDGLLAWRTHVVEGIHEAGVSLRTIAEGDAAEFIKGYWARWTVSVLTVVVIRRAMWTVVLCMGICRMVMRLSVGISRAMRTMILWMVIK